MPVIIIAGMFLFFSAGCSTTGRQPEGLPQPERVHETELGGPAATFRSDASHSLTCEGYDLLRKKDYDGAVRLLERAVGINPADGPGYYYLAEAWLKRGNYKLAFQFNRLALIYLRQDRKWADRARKQQAEIKEKEKND